ncbi:MAG: hypothetical protein QXL18_04925, partial [Candidatus Woesearchaeota archaeon]
ISLLGTIISINKINAVEKLRVTTGYALSDEGVALINISSSTSIKFAVNTIDWGTGIVNTSGGYINCTMNTEGSNSLGCSGFNTVTQGFVLENDGNTMVGVQLYSNASAAQFIGGGETGNNPLFMYKVSNNESNSCISGLNPTSYNDVNTTPLGTTICSSNSFNFTDNSDSLRIDILINIPYNAPSGEKSATFTATAS